MHPSSTCQDARPFFRLLCGLMMLAMLLTAAPGCHNADERKARLEAAMTKDRPDGVPVRSPGHRLNGETMPANRRSGDDIVPSPPGTVLGTKSPRPPPPTTQPESAMTRPDEPTTRPTTTP